jgi:hypothetical protein
MAARMVAVAVCTSGIAVFSASSLGQIPRVRRINNETLGSLEWLDAPLGQQHAAILNVWKRKCAIQFFVCSQQT